jgi:hypothetical protein
MIILLLVAFWDYSYNMDLGLNYDNNVYAYSQRYIDDFLHNIRPYRFPFETYDDMVTAVDLRLLIRNKFFGPRTTTFSLDLNTENYIVNNQKNFQKYTFGLRQSFGKYAVKLTYQIIPSYLIRYYRNPHGSSTEYIGCEATYHTISGKISYATKKNIILSAGYGHKWDNYIKEFNRYDASGHIISFNIEKQLRKYLNFNFGYSYRTSEADSADVVASATEATPDGSYYQHSLGTDLEVQMVIVFPTTLRLSYDYGFRNYTASNPADSLHFGRQDNRHRVSINAYSRILTGVRLKLSFMRQWRAISSEISAHVSEIKDYTKYKVGAGLEFYQ